MSKDFSVDPGWEATKGEYEITNGNAALVKVTYEQKKKGAALTRLLQILGGVAIFLPLVSIAWQNWLASSNQKKKDKALLYGQIIKDYATIFRHQNNNPISLNTIDSVDFLLASEINSTSKDAKLFQDVDQLNVSLSLYATFNKNLCYLDSLKKLSYDAVTVTKNIATLVAKAEEEAKKTGKPFKSKYRLLRDFPGYDDFLNFQNTYFAFYNAYVDLDDKKYAEYLKTNPELKPVLLELGSLFKTNYEYLHDVQNVLTENGSMKNEYYPVDSLFLPDYLQKLNARQADNSAINKYISNLEAIREQLQKLFEQLRGMFTEIKKRMQKDIQVTTSIFKL